MNFVKVVFPSHRQRRNFNFYKFILSTGKNCAFSWYIHYNPAFAPHQLLSPPMYRYNWCIRISSPQEHTASYFSSVLLLMPLSRSNTYSRTISTGRHFTLRKKITSAMSKSKKSTRCCPARTRVAASSHTSVNPVEPKKQSTLDATVASARIVARITQINGRNLSKMHYSMCLTDMRCSRFQMLCGPL